MNAIGPASSQMTLSPAFLTAERITESQEAKPVEMAKQFESLFVSMLIKEMRQSSGSEEGMFPGDSSDTYGGIFDMYMGQHIAEGGGIGLSEMIARSVRQ
ncbi:MAG TPA: rod-binding protein [Planctomicrobium sp.]|nr:rod-binding protein [Planctomicrobium sp.]